MWATFEHFVCFMHLFLKPCHQNRDYFKFRMFFFLLLLLFIECPAPLRDEVFPCLEVISSSFHIGETNSRLPLVQ